MVKKYSSPEQLIYSIFGPNMHSNMYLTCSQLSYNIGIHVSSMTHGQNCKKTYFEPV